MESRRLLLTGATGMVGGLALRDALRRPQVAEVTSIGRRAVALADPRLRQVELADFGAPGAVAEAFDGQDAALFCLGAYTGSVPEAELRRLTVDVAVAFAETLRRASPAAAFCLLSGQGADPTGRSRFAFARLKGEAERAILGLGFPRVYFFRPGYVYPVEPRREPNLTYRALRFLYPLLRRVYPNLGVASDDLARAMVHAALFGTGAHGQPALENRAIRSLAAEARGD